MNLIKSLSIYTLVSGLNSMVPLLLLPILTSYLSVAEYGLLAIIQIFIIFIMPFVSINISSYLIAEYHRVGKHEFPIMVGSVLCIPMVSILVVMLMFCVFESTINIFLGVSSFWIIFIPVIAATQVIPQTIMAIYQISENPINYGKYLLSLTVLNVVTSVGLVAIVELSWEGRLLAIFFSNLFFSVFGIGLLLKNKLLVLKIEKKYIYKAFQFGLPLIIHVISGALFLMSDRLFISYFLGNEEVGFYAVGLQVAMIVMVIQHAFNQAWSPYLFKNLKTDTYENRVKIVKISYIAFVFFLILPFVVNLLSYPIFDFFINKKFLNSIEYVFWIALGFGFLGMYKVVTNYIFYEKKIYILSLMTFLSLIVNFILNYILLHMYGAIGVAYATAITLCVFFISAFIVANRVHKMPWLFFIK